MYFLILIYKLMKTLTRKAFTLVELLVVITILAIISVVAYQSF
jgi:prepilin-type N-terminal cleavage/methylation domain-containing protein